MSNEWWQGGRLDVKMAKKLDKPGDLEKSMKTGRPIATPGELTCLAHGTKLFTLQ